MQNPIFKARRKFAQWRLSSLYKTANRRLPLAGFVEGRTAIRYVEMLSDADLKELNQLLKWNCFVVDSQGRRFGGVAWGGKRSDPQPIPDRRIRLMHEHFNLSDKTVLELGCFEGVHTVGLMQHGARVTAVDARIENVVKTITRTAFFGLHPTVLKLDIESPCIDEELLRADLGHHVGVLYHLKDPVTHLLKLGCYVTRGLMIDTHYAEPWQATELYEAGGRCIRYRKVQEFGLHDVFSGVYEHSKWLLLEDIHALLQEAGFANTTLFESRKERNGPRALIFASRA